ncbi:MAG TPA: beta-galactosidase [Tepidisphaeraceae bacterium]|nr:beta-galactosidase [Tepidisphaeraceae bacterium]
MRIGTYYYPEQWPREQWQRDFDNIAGMGLQIVHMGEFAWFSLEPSPGEFRLDWLEECVESCAERNLDVILCTPTAAPPVWLARGWPEILPVYEGRVKDFGGRQHYVPTSPALRDAAARVVTALAERFADHPAVVGWQIDNEYGGPFAQNDHTHAAFQTWLRRRYGSIDTLNRAWGCQFWNQFYTDFAQVRMPASRDARYANPHHHLDASRFWSRAWADFNKLQADVLRPRLGKRFLTTNFMPFHLDANPADMAADLTITTWDQYAVHGWDKGTTDQSFRFGDPTQIQCTHDVMASYHHGRWALMELQPGQVNWSGVPALLYPDVVRLWLWTAFAHGAEFVTTYRYRQPRFGIELFHHGLVEPDGVTPSAGGRQFEQVIREIRKLDLRALPAPADDEDLSEAVGLVFDFEQLWYYETLPQSRKWDQKKLVLQWYAAAARLGLRVKVLHPDRPWPRELPVVVCPGLQMVDDALVRKMEGYARHGGHLVLTCRTALMDRTGQLFEGPTAAPILPLIGGRIEAYDGLPDDVLGKIEFNGKLFAWNAWGDLVRPGPGTQVLGKYADQFYAGTAAVTRHKFHGGLVTYCGTFAEDGLAAAVVEQVAAERGLKVAPLPPRVRVVRRGPYHVALNYRDQPADAPAPASATFVVGERRMKPAGVAVWAE